MNQTWMTTTQEKTKLQPWTLPVRAVDWSADYPGLARVTQKFSPISLDQMDSVALLDRIDTKFLMTTQQMMIALEALQEDYWMLCVGGQRLNHYRTLYFDTPDFGLYHLHVNDRAERFKVRSREYIDSHLSFLEVKHRTQKGRTIKDRISTEQPIVRLDRQARTWLRDVLPYDSIVLEPKIWNTFTRITLVSKSRCERVTLDVNLAFYAGEKFVHLGGLAIAEVKMDASNCASSFLAQMRAQKIRQGGFSKYCVGVSMMFDQVKKNPLKPKLITINKLLRGYAYHD